MGRNNDNITEFAEERANELFAENFQKFGFQITEDLENENFLLKREVLNLQDVLEKVEDIALANYFFEKNNYFYNLPITKKIKTYNIF